jgi:iron complex outermembrane receptor protein
MNRLTLLIIILLFNANLSTAQVSTGTISGSVIDGGDHKVIDAATISLFKANDSSLIKISLADKAGTFVFEDLSFGKYYLVVTSTGHQKIYSPVVELSNSKKTANVGKLLLKNNVTTLSNISISAALQKPFIERKIDRTIINVDASITNAGTTALEVLEKSPGVTVDKDGNISLKGKSGVMVMMDGRPSYLSGPDLANLLKNMPSSSIEQIEIMTNPSAKYDAAGNSGIINIKTKKNKSRGLNGSLTAGISQAKYTRTNNSLNLNYHTGKINLFANINYSYWKSWQDLYILRKFRDSSTKAVETIFNQQTIMQQSSTWQNAKVGLDFFANKKTTAGIVMSGFLNPGNNTGANTNLLENPQQNVDSIVVANNHEKSKSNNLSLNLNLRHQFDTTGKEFSVDIDYLNYSQLRNQFYVNQFLNPDYSERLPENELKGTLPSNINIYSAKTDFTFPLSKAAKLETGAKTSYVTTDNNALYQDNTSSGYVTDLGKTNHFIYKENVNAAYINYSTQIKKFGFQAGLRAENTNAHGHQIGDSTRADSSFTKNYTNLFPTVYLSYEMNNKNTFSINYGRRIDRPAYQDLNPFYYFLDEYTYEVGNTLLQPQFTDNIELSHTYKGFLTTTVNYSNTQHVFTDVLEQNTAKRITYQTKENIATHINYGLSVSAYFPVTKFLTTNIYTNIVHDSYSGELNGGYLDVSDATFFANMSNEFKFKKGWSAELSGFYRSKGIESQIVMSPMWRLDAGLQKKVLKNKGSIKCSVRDIFNSQMFKGYVKYQDIDVNIKNIRDSRTASLTFTYNFGKPVQDQQHRKTGGASEEQNRVKTGN